MNRLQEGAGEQCAIRPIVSRAADFIDGGDLQDLGLGAGVSNEGEHNRGVWRPRWHSGCSSTGWGIDCAKSNIDTLHGVLCRLRAVLLYRTERLAELNGKVACDAEGGKWNDLTRRCDPDY